MFEVTAILIFDAVHQAFITHTVYTYTVTDWGNPVQLQKIVWSLLVEVILTGITAFIIQVFLTIRIWRLSHNKYITGTCLILAAGGLVVTFVYVAKAFQLENFSDIAKAKAESLAINIFGAATDLLIAGTLCTILSFSRTGFQRTDAIINKLILFSVNTGLLTSLCALASLISILAAPQTFIYIAFYFCLGRLYTNSLLATLNARKIIARGTIESESESLDTMSFSLRDVSQPRAIAIKINTTEYHNRDQTPDENSDSQAARVSPCEKGSGHTSGCN